MRKIADIRDGGTMYQIDKQQPLEQRLRVSKLENLSNSGGGHRGI